VLHQQPEDQFQMQHRRKENNQYKKIIRLSRNYISVEKVNIRRQLVTEYINIFGIIIQLNDVNLVKVTKNMQNKHKETR
jgi:hypothetical protein